MDNLSHLPLPFLHLILPAPVPDAYCPNTPAKPRRTSLALYIERHRPPSSELRLLGGQVHMALCISL